MSARASVKRTLAPEPGVAEEGRVAKDNRPRLRADPLADPFRIVLVEPEIPQNTGNIARLSAATRSPLHLVELSQHLDLAHFGHEHPRARLRLFSAVATTSYLDAGFLPGDALVFGRESVGLDPDLLDRHPGAVFGIPTLGPVRSLNLANSVAIVVYEALRQTGALARAVPG